MKKLGWMLVGLMALNLAACEAAKKKDKDRDKDDETAEEEESSKKKRKEKASADAEASAPAKPRSPEDEAKELLELFDNPSSRGTAKTGLLRIGDPAVPVVAGSCGKYMMTYDAEQDPVNRALAGTKVSACLNLLGEMGPKGKGVLKDWVEKLSKKTRSYRFVQSAYDRWK
jgi:hypothetical protein